MRGNRNSAPFFIKFVGLGRTVSTVDITEVVGKMEYVIVCE